MCVYGLLDKSIYYIKGMCMYYVRMHTHMLFCLIVIIICYVINILSYVYILKTILCTVVLKVEI